MATQEWRDKTETYQRQMEEDQSHSEATWYETIHYNYGLIPTYSIPPAQSHGYTQYNYQVSLNTAVVIGLQLTCPACVSEALELDGVMDLVVFMGR